MKRVMVFGVFDLLHPGHVNFLKQAKKLGDFLIVSIARDINVKKTKKFLPLQNEKIRFKAIKKLSFVNKAVLGGKRSPWRHIKKEKPDIIALGYDQKNYVKKAEVRSKKKEEELKIELQKHNINARVIRLKAFNPKKFKSSIIRKKHGKAL